MKMFKRLAAVLLAGVMVLAMLTACGGAGEAAKTDEQKLEDTYQQVLNAAFGTDYQNNATLQDAARKYLATNLKDGALSASAKDMAIVSTPDKDGNVIVAMIVDQDGMTDEELKQVISNPEEVDKLVAELKSSPYYGLYSQFMQLFIKDMSTGVVRSGNKTFAAIAISVPQEFAETLVD